VRLGSQLLSIAFATLLTAAGTLARGTVSLSDYTGRPVFLRFWAS